MLEALGACIDDGLIGAWRARIEQAGARLGWLNQQIVARRHAAGVSLAITAPIDQLFLATEVNEWALCAALFEQDPIRWSELETALIAQAVETADNSAAPASTLPPTIEESAAFLRFDQLSRLESKPALRALLEAATVRGLPYVVDESDLTLGTGAGGRDFPLARLPAVAEVRWEELQDIPTALVTGSNGKTTTVRLLAALARAHGWRAGYNCTDGVYLGEEALALGDYSGPAGARMVMRDRRTQAAILETARGGILRRGIAVSQAHTAVVTNVSADHFGEYGIDDLAGLAQVKLAVASVVPANGLLVVNAADPQLRMHAEDLVRRFGRSPLLGWFTAESDQELLREHRLRGASTCGVRAGRLHLTHGGVDHDLGPIAAMPLSMEGIALYNVANMAGAALAAVALGIEPKTIATVLLQFGRDPQDNPGRMMRYEVGGVTVLIDYAHNPDGLRGFLKVADHLRSGAGRLGLLLGHAGNRKNEDIEELAQAAAEFKPDLVVVKENEAQLRGRAPGEVPRIISAALRRLGLAESALRAADSEVAAAQCALDWARPGDMLALPLHTAQARAAVAALLETRRKELD